MRSPRYAIRFSIGLALCAFTAMTYATPAAATPASDGGARLHTNAELARTLAQIERASDGRVDVRSVGTSNEGRPLWFATLGTGRVRLLYVTQQHGDDRSAPRPRSTRCAHSA